MIWQPRDCHAHTTMSDGTLDVAGVVRVAAERGVLPSVSDHISRDVASAVDSIEGVEAYLDALDEHPVARGGEFCWHDGLWRELPERLVRRFTHRLGSLHAVALPDGRLLNMWHPRLPDGLAPAAYMEIHVAAIERFAREMPVDILAHPTLLPMPMRALPGEEIWSEAHEERVVAALRGAGIAFEVSSRYHPHERLVRRAWESGVRLSLGSDGHAPEHVANVEFSLAMTRRIGVPDEELYDPFVHGSRTGATGRVAAGA